MFARRFSQLMLLLASLALAGGLSLTQLSCDSSEAEAKPNVSKELLDKLRKEAKGLRQKIDALPVHTPDQRVAHVKIKTKWSACRIVLEGKTNARLGKLTEESYLVALADINAVKDMLKKYPR